VVCDGWLEWKSISPILTISGCNKRKGGQLNEEGTF